MTEEAVNPHHTVIFRSWRSFSIEYVGSLLPIWGCFVSWHFHLVKHVLRMSTSLYDLVRTLFHLHEIRICKILTGCKIIWFHFLYMLNFIQICLKNYHKTSSNVSIKNFSRHEIERALRLPCTGDAFVWRTRVSSHIYDGNRCASYFLEPFYHSLQCWNSHQLFFTFNVSYRTTAMQSWTSILIFCSLTNKYF